jgi:hypothetical protein
LEKRAEHVVPGSKVGEGDRDGVGDGGKNDPNNVCTYEYTSKKKIIIIIFHPLAKQPQVTAFDCKSDFQLWFNRKVIFASASESAEQKKQACSALCMATL